MKSTSTKALFETLRNAKFDTRFWNTLSVKDCLRYDYKQFIPSCGTVTKFGMSSLLCRIETLAIKPDVSAAVREFSRERGLDCLAVMTTTLNGGTIRKELLVFVENERRSEQIREFLESSPQVAFLKLRRKEGASSSLGGSENSGRFLWWEMGNAVPSRKQIAPVIISFYESLG